MSAGAGTGDLDLLRQAAEAAGTIALGFWRHDARQWLKEGTSPVSEADIAVDRHLKRVLLDARPDYGWLSEETQDDPARLERRRVFVVDPIDGTRGFLSGSPEWCVSIAVVEDGTPIAGVIAAPALGRTFHVAAGHGAFEGPVRLAIPNSPALTPEGALIVAGPRHWTSGSPDMRQTSYIPSLALRLVYVAAGRLHAALVKASSHDWDLAAADLLVHEAGGAVFDEAGRRPAYNRPDPSHGALAASPLGLRDRFHRVLTDRTGAMTGR